MSETDISEKIMIVLWGRAGGRCQYEGCNKDLTVDTLTKRLRNRGYIAHIYADKKGGPRWDAKNSPKLKKDISNLMLLCDDCHRRIDKDEVDSHPADRLIEMKKNNEQWVKKMMDMSKKPETYPIKYYAKIGKDKIYIEDNEVTDAIIAENYCPALTTPIDISIKGSEIYDNEENFWEIEKNNLTRKISQLYDRYENLNNISICALAPIPLLVYLGTLLDDKKNTRVYQKRRDKESWCWDNTKSKEMVAFKIIPPSNNDGSNIAINISLSANIQNDIIQKTLGEDVSIWTFTIENPTPNFVTNRNILKEFNKNFIYLLNEIKKQCKSDGDISIFPAVPVSIAIEIGRARMAKADLNFILYDMNRDNGGFIKTFSIS